MKRWSISVNEFYRRSSVTIEEAPALVFWIEDLVEWVCYMIPRWRIPWIGNLRILEDDYGTYFGRRISFNEKYGSIKDFFCLRVHLPIMNNFAFKYKKFNSFDLDKKEFDRVFEYVGYDGWKKLLQEFENEYIKESLK